MVTHSSPEEEPPERIALPASSCGNQLTPDYLINSRLEGLCLQLLEATNLELAEQKAEAQRTRSCRAYNPQRYVHVPSPKTQGSLLKRGRKACKSQRR